jgi:hypothetical protein
MGALDLPGDVLAAILCRWIDIQALARLDTAMCASKARTTFLELMEAESFVVDTMCMLPRERYTQKLLWLTKRRIKVRNWTVHRYVAESRQLRELLITAGPHLLSLQLYKLSPFSMARVLPTLALTCSGLQALEMEDCPGWDMVSSLSASAQQSLQDLIVANSDSGQSWEPCALFSNLRKVYLRDLEGADVAQSVTSLLNAAPRLTDLRLSSYNQFCPISDESLQVLSNHAAGLEVLELDIQRQELSSTALASLAARCTSLKTLSLFCGGEVNDAVVEAFARHCLRLAGLKLWGRFSAVALSAVAVHCRSLQYLSLDMYHCAADGLKSLAEHSWHLEELQLRNCLFRAEESLVRLVSSLPRLRELLFVDSTVVTDAVLTAIATHLPNLATLGLSGSYHTYTEAGAHAVVNSLTQLRRFCIRTCDLSVFTPALRNRWQEVSPGLEICDDFSLSTRHFEHMRW